MAIIGISGKIGSGKDTVGRIIQMLTSPNYRSEYFYRIGIDVNRLSEYDFSDSKWQIKKFAGKLKQIVSIITGIPVEDLEKQEVKDRVLGEEWNHVIPTIGSYKIDGNNKLIPNQYTVRLLLQRVGTEAMRDVIHPNIWINALFVDYIPIEGSVISLEEEDFFQEREKAKYPNWIITDLRFPNELKAIEDRGGITIRVNRFPKEININEQKRVFDKGNEIHLKEYYKGHYSETALDNAKFKHTINNDRIIEELIEKVKNILIQEKIL